MKTILTLKYGEKYSSEAVNSIYEQTQGKYNYICVTDDPKGLHPDIKVIYIEHEPEGNMEKIKLFQLKANPGETIMYLDLDIRIQKDIDHMFDYCNNYPVIAYTWWKDKGIDEMPIDDFPYHSKDPLSNFNSSIMLWKDATHIWNHYCQNPDEYIVKYPHGDDTFLYHEGFTFEHLPREEVYSYMFSGRKYKPEYTICLLNGQAQYPEIEKEYDELCVHQMGD
jgi:hypothetical protein